MIPRKLAETFFRRLWLLVIPIVLVPVLAFLLVETPVEYESSARIWVSRVDTIDAGSSQARNGNEKSPAEVQIEVLGDLLATDAFRLEVAAEAGLVTNEATAAERLAAVIAVGRAVTIGTIGPNLFGLTAKLGDADAARRVADAVISRYQLRIKSDADREAAVVLDYFQSQLGVANDELARVQGELAAYVLLHPTPANDLLTPDAEYLRLKGKVDAQVKVVDRLNASLQDAQLAAVAEPTSQLATFNVQDAPLTPDMPIPTSIAARAIYPAAGLFLGLFISAAFLYLSYRTDYSVRSREDLAGLPVPLLGYVPELKHRRRGLLRKLSPLRLFGRPRGEAAVIASSISRVTDHSAGAR